MALIFENRSCCGLGLGLRVENIQNSAPAAQQQPWVCGAMISPRLAFRSLGRCLNCSVAVVKQRDLTQFYDDTDALISVEAARVPCTYVADSLARGRGPTGVFNHQVDSW